MGKWLIPGLGQKKNKISLECLFPAKKQRSANKSSGGAKGLELCKAGTYTCVPLADSEIWAKQGTI